ncbi:signal peptidase II [Streptomyces radicis]|uniref:Lipoprotein signal peptidase n=1 Tax=Streptomyces radicis TaxID=1750517 RepID=A0A3A9W092_9ACTN|nr:signal peptidase II [Streptomyces radicis]RKN06162.1 signal peptidase II [Streptomyces radicis]RKN18533.1 signal peptidase II [Streptomyces radicis]
MSEAERTIETPDDPEDVAEATPEATTAEAAAVDDEREPEDEEPGAGRGRRRIGVLAGVAAFAYLLDLVTKIMVVEWLEHEEPIDIFGEWLRFEALRNGGAAFGIGEALTVVFTCIAATVIVVIIRLARKLYSAPWAVALGLLLGGALGNLTDRLFRAPGALQGHVVDFIAPKYFAVFNLADSAIVCGGILIVLLSFRGLDPDGTVHRD